MRLRFLACLSLVCALACSDDIASPSQPQAGAGGAGGAGAMPAAGGGGTPGVGQSLAVVAEWLNRSLSIVDLAQLKEGATRASATVATIDLSQYDPLGPLDVAITPDGKLALVSISAGFFSFSGAAAYVGAMSVPSGPGKLVFVDLAQRAVVGDVDTGNGPMDIAITHDGKRAFVPHFGSTHVAVVDIAQRVVEKRVEIGPYSEEIELDDTGTVGVIAYSAAGDVLGFNPTDLQATLSPPVSLTGDAAGVAFFPGTKSAYIVQAPTPLNGMLGGRNVVDVTNPSAPVVTENVRSTDAPGAYPCAPVPKRQSVVVPTSKNKMLAVDEYKLGPMGEAMLVQTLPIAMISTLGAYGIVVDPAGRLLMASPGERFIAVADLEAKKAFTVPWPGELPGPADIAIIP
jgi:DNA-binding beta-propeller fold protein YncE